MSATLWSRSRPLNPDPQPAPLDGAPGAGDSIPQANDPTPLQENQKYQTEQEKEELLQRAIVDYKTSRDHFQEWRQEASECFDFVASHQWSEEDKQVLADQSRPAITFNRIGPFVDGVCGLEIGNRQTTQFSRRQVGNSGVTDLMTEANQWARDECDAEDEESESFRDVIICGVGCTTTLMDYDQDPDGMPVIERVDPLEKFPDPSSRKQNFADARFDMRCKDIPLASAQAMFPDTPAIDLHAQWAEDQPDETRQPHNARLAPFYRVDQAGEIDRQRQMVRMVEYEWWEYELAYRVLDPDTGRFIRLTPEKTQLYEAIQMRMGRQVTKIRDKQRKYWKAIIGNVVLKVMKGADNGGFQDKYITGKRDRNRGVFYGLVRAMRDPQMWANKWLSQALQIVNTNAKGGLLAETDAFVDINEARDAWAESDSIIELNPGGLGKIQQKQPPAFPVQINQMTQFAIDAIPAVSGVNLEMIAQVQRDQPGVLEMQRKQQGMTVLAAFFNAKRRYQKEQGRLMLWMIQTFISDGRLIRIGGPENAKYVPLMKAPGVAEYDVIVDDAPSSPNMKERVWAGLMQMFPMLRGLPLPPSVWIEFMRYSPFPSTLVEKVSQLASQPPPPPQPKPATPLDQARIEREAAAARHLDAKTLQVGASTGSEVQERQARIESLRAGAAAALAKVGLAQTDQHMQEASAAVDAFLRSHELGHDQAMQHINRGDRLDAAAAAQQQSVAEPGSGTPGAAEPGGETPGGPPGQ